MVLEAGWLLAGAEELLLGPEGREPASKKETAQYCPRAGASSCQTATPSPPYDGSRQRRLQDSWQGPEPSRLMLQHHHGFPLQTARLPNSDTEHELLLRKKVVPFALPPTQKGPIRTPGGKKIAIKSKGTHRHKCLPMLAVRKEIPWGETA